MRLASSPLAAGCGICCLALAALLFSSALGQAGGDKLPANLEPFKEKFKDLEASFRKTLHEAVKEAEDLEKKADQVVKKLFDEQLKTKDKDKKDKIKIDLDQAREERDRIAGFRKHYQAQLSGLKAVLGWDRLEDRLGAAVSAPNALIVDQLGLKKGEGVVVEFVPVKTLAAKIGLKPFDIVVKLGGQTVPSAMPAYKKFANDIKIDAPVEAVILRHGKQMTLSSANAPEPGKKSEDAPKEKSKKADSKDDSK